MTTIPQTQDLPRPGGFPSIRYKRNLPKRGPSGAVVLTAMAAISAYGFYQLKREKSWGRIHLVPLLQAELDRDTYRRTLAALDREAEIMKDVPGWKVGESVYHNTRYKMPTHIVVPEKDV
ncbi:10282_t:CDS:2 [Diversispora eburnea]|uniref:NADH dehydrogenase [ubiquinone] 1 alpha subcomplex subunit 13 n=1 Tax=Diversispora eburnea TaxID=1213867 RepID=A0A9N9A4D5_9GLOM|nr:10282_t:CDS:2 [Diversispora eburnea]